MKNRRTTDHLQKKLEDMRKPIHYFENWKITGEKSKHWSCLSYRKHTTGYLNKSYLGTDEFQLINERRIQELEYHHSAAPTELTERGNSLGTAKSSTLPDGRTLLPHLCLQKGKSNLPLIKALDLNAILSKIGDQRNISKGTTEI